MEFSDPFKVTGQFLLGHAVMKYWELKSQEIKVRVKQKNGHLLWLTATHTKQQAQWEVNESRLVSICKIFMPRHTNGIKRFIFGYKSRWTDFEDTFKLNFKVKLISE